MNARLALSRADALVGSLPGRWVTDRLDLFGGPGAPLETAVFLDSFLPSLMPRTSLHQGLAAGVNVLTARVITGAIATAHRAALGLVAVGTSLGVRGVEALVGHGLANLPEVDNESLWRAGARTTGDVLRAAAIGRAVYDAVGLFRTRAPGGALRPLVSGAVATSALLV